MKYLICLLLLFSSVVMAGSVSGTLTSTATVVSNPTTTVSTPIALPNGEVMHKDLPKGAVVKTVVIPIEEKKDIKITIIY